MEWHHHEVPSCWQAPALVLTVGLGCCACGSSMSTGQGSTSSVRGPASTASSSPPTTNSSPTPTTSASQPLTVSTTNLAVDRPITVSGGHCASGHLARVSLAQDPTGGPQVTYNFGEFLGQKQAAGDGNWQIEAALPAMIIGPARIVGECLDPTTGTSDFTYSPIAVKVTTPYHLQVNPPEGVRAGSTLTVSSVGGGCDSVSRPDVYLWSAGQPNPLTGIGEVVGPTTGPGPWNVTLTIPTSTAPGDYQVVARCTSSRSYRITYQPEPIAVGAG